MTKLTKSQQAAQDEARAKLRELLPVGSTVHTILRHVSKSGMMRHISLVVVTDGELRDITWLAARATGDKLADGNGWAIKVGGVGMDMGFALVYGLSRAIYADGHKCTGSNGRTPSGNVSSIPRCPSNDHSNDYNRLAREFDESHPKTADQALSADRETHSRYVSVRQAWINGQRTYSKTRTHQDSGYALLQRWL